MCYCNYEIEYTEKNTLISAVKKDPAGWRKGFLKTEIKK